MKVGSSVSPVRVACVLDGVSSPRPVSDDTCDRVRALLGAKPIAQPYDYASTIDDRVDSSAGLRQAACKRERRRDVAAATTIWFRSGGDYKWSRTRDEEPGSRNFRHAIV